MNINKHNINTESLDPDHDKSNMQANRLIPNTACNI